jgi:predicted transcriptional regulator
MTRRGDVQAELLHSIDRKLAPQPVFMAVFPRFYKLIWSGEKRYEYRRRYIDGASTWYPYLFTPVAGVVGRVSLGEPIIASPTEIADVAETEFEGHGDSVYQYVRGLRQAYAIPILRAEEHGPVPIGDLREVLGTFNPPKDYLRLLFNARLLTRLEDAMLGPPLRSIDVEAAHKQRHRWPNP